MNHDDIITAHTDLAAVTPEDEDTCCYTSCETCCPEPEDIGPVGLDMSVQAQVERWNESERAR